MTALTPYPPQSRHGDGIATGAAGHDHAKIRRTIPEARRQVGHGVARRLQSNGSTALQIEPSQGVASGVHRNATPGTVQSDGGAGSRCHGPVACHREQLGHFASRAVYGCGVEKACTPGNAGRGENAEDRQQDDLFDEGTAISRAHGARLCAVARGTYPVYRSPHHSSASLQPAMPMRPSHPTPLAARTRVRRRAVARLLTLQTIAAIGFFLTSCSLSIPAPTAGVSSAQAIMDLESAVLQMREDNSLLQAQIDSLRDVTAYQDTILRQLAALSNLSMRPPSSMVP